MKKMYYLILVVLFSAGAVSCKKEKNNSTVISNFPYYFSATVNGVNVKYEADDLNSIYGCGISRPESSSENYSTGDFNYDIYEGTFFRAANDEDHNLVKVHILKYFKHVPSYEERDAMIIVKDYGYGVSETSTNTINGASIEYTDANGKIWSSEKGVQEGSKFSIIELADNKDGSSKKIFTAKFSCKLYDETGENSVSVLDGVVRGKILYPSLEF